MNKKLVVAIAGALVGATVTFAQDDARKDRPERPRGGFLAVARTEDGKIDLSKLPEQMPQERKDALKTADKDGDGFLNQEEMKSVFPNFERHIRPDGERGFWFRPFGEAMKDGKLELAKLPEQMPQERKDALKAADKDGDGFLNREEMREARAQFLPKGAPEGMCPEGDFEGKEPDGDRLPPMPPQQFGAFHPGFVPFGGAMKDGKFELAKLPEQMPQERKDALKAADKDSDGFLTREEMREIAPPNFQFPKFKFPEGKKPCFINDDNAFDVEKTIEAIKGCDKNNDGVIDADEQRAAANFIRENWGPSFGMFLHTSLGGSPVPFSFDRPDFNWSPNKFDRPDRDKEPNMDKEVRRGDKKDKKDGDKKGKKGKGRAKGKEKGKGKDKAKDKNEEENEDDDEDEDD